MVNNVIDMIILDFFFSGRSKRKKVFFKNSYNTSLWFVEVSLMDLSGVTV